MENSTNNYSLEDSISSFENIFYDPNFDNNRRTKSNGAIVYSDIHGNYESLDNVYSIAQEKGLDVIINGDVVNGKPFMDLAHSFGYKTQQELFSQYAQENLEQFDFETLMVAQNYQQTQSLDPLLTGIPDHHKEQAKNQLEERLNYSQSRDFQEKFEQLAYSFKDEKQEEVIENQIGLNSLYQVFMDEEADKLAKQINKYNVNTIFNDGNHENALFTKQVREKLDDPNKLIDATNHRGYITIDQENGQELTIAGMTNCIHELPYLKDVHLSQQEYHLMGNHMKPLDMDEDLLISGNQQISTLEDKIAKDSNYQRVTNEENRSLDVFLTHGQIGEVYLNNQKGQDVPYLATAAKLSNMANLTIEGHIHGNYDGKTSFGNDMIRASGEKAAIISKDDNGNLQRDWIKVDYNFDGNNNNTLDYDLDNLKQKTQQVATQIKNQLLTAANDDEYYEEEQKQSA